MTTTYYAHSLVIETPKQLGNSLVFWCQTCGDAWARVVVEGARWEYVASPCAQHKPINAIDWDKVPGSILSDETFSRGKESTLLKNVPPQLLKAEFIAHDKWNIARSKYE